jgi:hypothetical protein
MTFKLVTLISSHCFRAALLWRRLTRGASEQKDERPSKKRSVRTARGASEHSALLKVIDGQFIIDTVGNTY